MKKIIFLIGFMIVYITLHAQKNAMNASTHRIFNAAAVTIFDTAALNLFKVLLKDQSYDQWAVKDPYDEISSMFMFNMFKGERISNYYNKSSFVGFSCRYTENDLPQEFLNRIKKRYSDCAITDVIIFMDFNGNTRYYASIKNNKRYIALKISGDKLSVLKKIPVK